MSRKEKKVFCRFVSTILACIICLTSSPITFCGSKVQAIERKDNEKKSIITVEYDVDLDKINCDKICRIHIKDKQFDPSRVNLVIKAEDKKGNDVKEAKTSSIKSRLKDKKMWTTIDKYTWSAEIKYDVDAIYTFDITYTDSTGNVDDSHREDRFIVDKTAPDPNKFKFKYSKPLVEKIIETVTFGYYHADMVINVEAMDNLSGVDYIKWACIPVGENHDTVMEEIEYNKINNEEITYSKDDSTATAIININSKDEAQFKGNFSFIVVDKAGNESAVKTDDSKVIVTDTIKPMGKIEYSKPSRIVKEKEDENGEEKTTLFYNNDADITLKIKETNFYEEDVVVKVNGESQQSLTWKQEGEQWISKIKIKDEGQYFITMEYVDKSSNEMEPCKLEKIIMDKTKPLLEVSYSGNQPSSVFNGREYYDDIQSATIKIMEQNFTPEDINIKLEAKDVEGKDISVEDYNEYLKNEESWIRDGDQYIASIIFSKDANYSINIQCSDLANNVSKEIEDKLFTIDRTPPTNLSISYSTSLLDKVVNFITFGYYNEKVKVTLTAEDDISGVMDYMYSYVNNGKTENGKTLQAVSHNGKISSASFELPKDHNQFNGTVQFVVSDRSKNTAETKGYKRIIVDNIAPRCNVEYNSPVHTSNNISYYKNEIAANISIIEENFYEEDVKVKISKNGAEGYAVRPTWSNGNNGKHIGRVKISDEGKYVVSIAYKDRSNNTMIEYKSQELIIDKSKPVVEIKNISNNVAKKDKNIGVVITASDLNFDAKKFVPKLQGVVKNKNGQFATINVPLKGTPASADGRAYSYSVDNIELDGIYSITCIATDLSGNETEEIATANSSNNTMSTVNFSVNRNGSTFKPNDNMDKIIKNHYVQNINNHIEIIETNVDELKGYNVTINGKEIIENKDYIVQKSGGKGEWNKYKYSINPTLFEHEGEYDVVVYSTDKADNKAFSDMKNAKVAFTVDRTEPVVVVSGLQEQGRYSEKTQTATIMPRDDCGRLNNIKIVVSDKDGKPILGQDGEDVSVRMDLSSEELDKALKDNANKLKFTIPSGLNMNVKVMCSDSSIDNDGKTNTYTGDFSHITVSDKWYVILYANKFLFNTLIASIVLIIISTGTVYIFKRKKRKGKEQAT